MANAQIINLFILTGQSNMVGLGELSELPVNYPRNPTRLHNYRLNHTWWWPARDPMHGSGVGPGLRFLDRLADLKPDYFGAVSCARSGSAAADWQKDSTWIVPGTSTNLYQRCLTQITEALAACPGGYACRIAGLYHAQGEAETVAGDGWQLWTELTARFFNDLRTELGKPDLPIIYNRLPIPSDGLLAKRPNWNNVREQQTAFTHPNVLLINTDRTADYGKVGLHLTTAQQLFVGWKAANRMNRLLPD